MNVLLCTFVLYAHARTALVSRTTEVNDMEGLEGTPGLYREIALFDIEEIMFGWVNFLRTIISKNINEKWKLWKRITLRSFRLEKKNVHNFYKNILFI